MRIALFLLALVSTAAAAEPADVVARVGPSVFLVEARGSKDEALTLGSAVAISPSRVVTNCHVVVDKRVESIRLDRRFRGMLVAKDVARDLCILQVDGGTFVAPAIRNLKDLRVGERVLAIGSPQGLTNTVSEGLLSSVRQMPNGDVLLQTSAAISPGSSGGGLFDESGRLLGVTSSFLAGGQNLNFAVPAEYISQVEDRALSEPRRESTPAEAEAIEKIRLLAISWRRADARYDEKLPAIQEAFAQIMQSGAPPQSWPDTATTAYEFVTWKLDAENYLAQRQWYQLTGHAERWIAVRPNFPYVHFMLARAYDGIASDEEQRAGEIAEELMGRSYDEKERGIPAIDQHHAMADGARRNAVNAVRRALDLDPQFASAWGLLGFLYSKQGDSSGALAVAATLDDLGETAAAQLLRQNVALNR